MSDERMTPERLVEMEEGFERYRKKRKMEGFPVIGDEAAIGELIHEVRLAWTENEKLRKRVEVLEHVWCRGRSFDG